MKWLYSKIYKAVIDWLTHVQETHKKSPNDFKAIRSQIKQADVLLVEGNTRVGSVIKNITRSAWSHSAICIGPLNQIENLALRKLLAEHYRGPHNEPLLIEAEIGRGTVVTPLSFYEGFHVRVARPFGLAEEDAVRVSTYMIKRLGLAYNLVQLLDLARFLFPWWTIVPRKWHSSLFEKNAGDATKNVCSSLIAEAFQSVRFPVLPLIESDNAGDLNFYKRNAKLCTPRDFDYSPFFTMLKFPLLDNHSSEYYKAIRWSSLSAEDKQRTRYMNSEDVVHISEMVDESAPEDLGVGVRND